MKLENFVIPLRYKIKPFLTSLRDYIEPKLCLIWEVMFLFDSCRINFKPIKFARKFQIIIKMKINKN